MSLCPIIIVPSECLGKFNPHRIFGMMWYNDTLILAATLIYLIYPKSKYLIQPNKKEISHTTIVIWLKLKRTRSIYESFMQMSLLLAV